jgi:hypothetical protein
MPDHPPYYILYSQSNTLGHPLIQYHYADDSPLSLLPLDDEQVLLLDFDPPSTVTAKSISKNIATAALNLAEAPGAALEDDSTNSTMYILETATITDEKYSTHHPLYYPLTFFGH